MGIAVTEHAADSELERDLIFQFLPPYAKHLLDNKLEEFAAHQQSYAKELQLPMLRYLSLLSKKQFHQLAVDSARDLLTALAQNNAEAFISSSLERWQSNMLPNVISRDQIAVDDITLIWHLRRLGFIEFLDTYTNDLVTWKNILRELDAFTAANETRACSWYVKTQRHLFNELQRLNGIGNFVWDIKTNRFEWSDELYRIYDLEPGTPVDYESIMRYTHPDDLEKMQSNFSPLRQPPDTYDYNYRIVTASGVLKVLHARGTLQSDANGKPVQMIGTLQDVTAQKQSEERLILFAEELRASEEQFRLLVSGVKDYAIFMLNPDGTIATWNLGAQAIKQYAAEEIIGKHFSSFYTDEDRARRHPQHELEIAVREGRYEEEGWRVRKDGTRFWASVTITAIRDETGTLRGFAKVTRDLTERMLASRRLEETVQELERSNKELSSFSYAASHDLQEPLRKIQTFATRILAKDASAISENSRDLFNRLVAAASRMQHLIDDLLTFSRVGTQTQMIAPVDLNALVDDIRQARKDVYDERRAEMRVLPLPTVIGSAVQLRQLFENLISNSLKYARPGVPPLISIDAQRVTVSLKNSAKRSSRYHKITVADNGIGFDPEYNERIFEMFQRLHSRAEYEGTGIGLSIVRKIVQAHGGFVEAHGEPGVGATFTVYLPLNNPEAESV